MANAPRDWMCRLAVCAVLAVVAFAGFTAPLRAETWDSASYAGGVPSTRSIDLPAPVYSILLDGDRGYVLGSWISYSGWFGPQLYSALSVYDFASTDPAHQLGTMQLFSSGSYSLAVQDGLAYLAGGIYLTIVDLADLANIHEVGFIRLSDDGWERCVAVDGGRAYVGDTAGLHVVDVADPAAPSQLGSVALSGEAISVALGGSFAYVGTLDARISVVDISDPVTPTVVATLSLPGRPSDIEIRGAHAYVAGGESGLQVLDVSRPAEPRLMGGVDTPGTAYDVSVGGARAYVADGAKLQVIDISNPARAAIVNSVSVHPTGSDGPYFPYPNSVTAVSVSHSRLVLGGGGERPGFDCVAGPGGVCNPYGYLEVGRAVDYGPAAPGLSRAARLDAGRLGGNPPAAPRPTAFGLNDNEPNPFNPETSIHFDVPHASSVRVRIVDARGSLVQTLVDGTLPPGRHEVSWRGRNENGESVASGIYFVTMEAEGFRQTLKITLLK